jgi:RNA polymerase sigma-70 factor, ECF subfamily
MEGGDGFDAFYRESYAGLVRQRWAVTGSRQDAEDVVQEAFVRAAARWGQVGTYELPEAWVRRVAIRLARNELRRVRRGLAALLRLRPAKQDGPSEDRPALVTALRGYRFATGRCWSCTTWRTCRSSRSPPSWTCRRGG